MASGKEGLLAPGGDVELGLTKSSAREVKLKGKGKGEEKVQVAPSIPCIPQDGGLNFLKIVSISFYAVAVIGGVLSIASFFEEDINVLTAILRLVLIPASALAGFVASANESLGLELVKFAEENDRLSESNDQMEAQLAELSGVQGKLDDLAASGVEDLEEVKNILTGIARQTDIARCASLMNAWADVQYNRWSMHQQRATKLIKEAEELEGFLDAVKPILQQNLKNTLSYDEFNKTATQNGVTLSELALLIAASNADKDEEAKGMISLMFFLMNPSDTRKQQAKTSISQHFRAKGRMDANSTKFGNDSMLEAELTRLQGNANRIVCEDATALVDAVLAHVQHRAGVIDEGIKQMNTNLSVSMIKIPEEP